MIRLSLQLQSNETFHYDVILTSALRSYICKKIIVADFPSDKNIFDCKNVSFCIELNTLIRLGIANFFLIFQCCYFYVMSQSTFVDQIRPRPLIACLNCAACPSQENQPSHWCSEIRLSRRLFYVSVRGEWVAPRFKT